MSHVPCPFDGSTRIVVSANQHETTVRCPWCQTTAILDHTRRWEWDQ